MKFHNIDYQSIIPLVRSALKMLIRLRGETLARFQIFLVFSLFVKYLIGKAKIIFSKPSASQST